LVLAKDAKERGGERRRASKALTAGAEYQRRVASRSPLVQANQYLLDGLTKNFQRFGPALFAIFA
jgi:hypothetical protein